jgi:hypothetical protein
MDASRRQALHKKFGCTPKPAPSLRSVAVSPALQYHPLPWVSPGRARTIWTRDLVGERVQFVYGCWVQGDVGTLV